MSKRRKIPGVLALAAFACHAPLSAYAAVFLGKVDGIKLNGGTAVYSFSEAGGEVRSGRLPLYGPAATEEAERVRRVALFGLWLERDPFFLSPGTEMGGLERAARKLAGKLEEINSIHKSPMEIAPAPFLLAYAETSSAFDRFSDAPSEDAAAEVLSGIRRGVEAYRYGAEKTSAILERSFNFLQADYLAGIGGAATRKATLISDFALIRKNADAAEKRLGELEKCLLVSSLSCKPAWPEPSPPPPAEGAEAPPDFLDRSILNFAVPLPPPAKKEPARGSFEKVARGPYKVNSACWNGKRENYLYYLDRCGPEGDCMEWSVLATDMFFTVYPEGHPRSKQLKANGLKLLSRSATAPYGCMDLEYKPNLEVLDYFTVNYSSWSAFGGFKAAAPALAPEAAAAVSAAEAEEKTFSAEKLKSQRSLERLGRSYLKALKALGDAEPAAGLLKRERLIALKTAGFAAIVNRIIFHHEHFLRKDHDPLRPFLPENDPISLYLARGHYSLVFMPFTPSVWLIPEKPAYLADLPPDAERRSWSIGYKKAVELYGRSEVEKSVKYFLMGHRRELIP